MTQAVQLYREVWCRRVEALWGVKVERALPWEVASYLASSGTSIRWNHRVDGASGLLHEVGHLLSRHLESRSAACWLDEPPADQLRMEREAWLAAEWLARLFGLRLDYKRADWCFDTYREYALSHGVPSAPVPWRDK